jgi:transcriptional regulator with XRE-family HTH domain
MPAPEPTLRRFGENVRTKREQKKLSQEKLADLDRTYVSSVERGLRNISMLSVVRIAKALKSSASQLCEGIEG